MTSIRNTPGLREVVDRLAGPQGRSATGTGTKDVTRETILDAAEACVLQYGARGTTLTAIARRAGVSRPTVYRYWPDARALFADLITRALVGMLPTESVEPGSAGRRLVDDLVTTAARVRRDPLARRILDVDPQLLTPYVFERLGSSQKVILAVLTHAIEAGHRDGSIRPGEADRQAAMVLLVVQSAVQSARIVRDQLDEEGLDTELRAVLEGYLEVRS